MPRYAYSTMLYASLPPAEAVARLVEDGLPVEVSYDNFAAFGGSATEERHVAELLGVASERGWSAVAVHLPYDWMDPARALSEAGVRRLRRWMEVAHKLGARAAVVHTLKIPRGEGALELNARLLRELAREAAERGLTLAVENRMERHLFGSRPEEVLDIVEAVGEGLWVCLDVGHANMNGGLAPFLSALGGRVAVLHVHDNDGRRDLHAPPYTGTVEWSLLETWLLRSGFSGVIVLEVLCGGPPSSCRGVVREVASSPIARL